MHSYAQTNIQLFNQLQREGYSNTDISCIVNAYKLAMTLFTGCFRPSGKTFIAHVVGTASILGSLHVPAKVVAASLIHAAYANNDFGNGERGITDAKRQQIRSAVGEEIEEYVARYKAFKWNEQNLTKISDRLDTLDSIDRNVVLMRLANELEEHLDLGLLYCGEGKYQQYSDRAGATIIEMAQKLGSPTLAKALATVFKETHQAKIPVEYNHQNSSLLIVPKSYQRRLFPVRHQLSNGYRRLRAIMRRLGHLHNA